MSPSEKAACEAAPPDPEWIVNVKRGCAKGLIDAGPLVQAVFEDLLYELATEGPVQHEWPNYRMLSGMKGQKKTEKRYHCHLKKGQPTYVAVWQVTGNSIEIDVTYAGTHSGAPYQKG